MYREWKKLEFPHPQILYMNLEKGLEVDQEIDGKMKWGRMGD